jgi:hypothetical protein
MLDELERRNLLSDPVGPQGALVQNLLLKTLNHFLELLLLAPKSDPPVGAARKDALSPGGPLPARTQARENYLRRPRDGKPPCTGFPKPFRVGKSRLLRMRPTDFATTAPFFWMPLACRFLFGLLSALRAFEGDIETARLVRVHFRRWTGIAYWRTRRPHCGHGISVSIVNPT